MRYTLSLDEEKFNHERNKRDVNESSLRRHNSMPKNVKYKSSKLTILINKLLEYIKQNHRLSTENVKKDNHFAILKIERELRSQIGNLQLDKVCYLDSFENYIIVSE